MREGGFIQNPGDHSLPLSRTTKNFKGTERQGVTCSWMLGSHEPPCTPPWTISAVSLGNLPGLDPTLTVLLLGGRLAGFCRQAPRRPGTAASIPQHFQCCTTSLFRISINMKDDSVEKPCPVKLDLEKPRCLTSQVSYHCSDFQAQVLSHPMQFNQTVLSDGLILTILLSGCNLDSVKLKLFHEYILRLPTTFLKRWGQHYCPVTPMDLVPWRITSLMTVSPPES